MRAVGSADVVTAQHATFDIPHMRAELTATYTERRRRHADVRHRQRSLAARRRAGMRAGRGVPTVSPHGCESDLHAGRADRRRRDGQRRRRVACGARRRRAHDARGTQRGERRARATGPASASSTISPRSRARARWCCRSCRRTRRSSVAEGFVAAYARGPAPPVYVDCNAIAPETATAIGEVIAAAGMRLRRRRHHRRTARARATTARTSTRAVPTSRRSKR